MRKVFFTPGPSQLYFTFEDHFRSAMKENIGSISHRSSAFQALFQHTTEQLTELLQIPQGYRLLFVSSATECWERIAQNLISSTSHHFVNGSFGEKFHSVADAFGKSAHLEWIDESFKPKTVESDLIAITMNETSTGFQHTMDEVKEMRKLNPDALIALDVVSAVPCIEIDFAQVDTSYFSVQKCFGMPAGLGVWILNEQAIDVASETNHPSYHSVKELIRMADKNQTPETPNVVGIYLLGKIAEDMNRRGISAIRNETNYKAALLYQTLEAHPLFDPAIRKSHRSKSTAVANTVGDSLRAIKFFEALGMHIGSGYGDHKKSQIRIANFPTHSKEQVELLCDSLEKFG